MLDLRGVIDVQLPMTLIKLHSSPSAKVKTDISKSSIAIVTSELACALERASQHLDPTSSVLLSEEQLDIARQDIRVWL